MCDHNIRSERWSREATSDPIMLFEHLSVDSPQLSDIRASNNARAGTNSWSCMVQPVNHKLPFLAPADAGLLPVRLGEHVGGCYPHG